MIASKRPSFRRFIETTLWPRLEQPLADIFVHLVVSFLSVLSIAFIHFVLYIAGLDGKVIPGSHLILQSLGFNTQVTLGDWMLMLEVMAATVIIIVGICKAIIGLARS
jgi:hypothetical protein